MPNHQRLFSGILPLFFASAPETVHVTHAHPSGPGSLRWAILKANARGRFTTILFNLPGQKGEERVLRLQAPLPPLTAPVHLKPADGQSGPTVLLAAGTDASQDFTAFRFEQGAEQSRLESLTFRRFAFAVDLCASGVTVAGNAFENNPGGCDILLTNANGATIRCNTFSGKGLALSGAGHEVSILRNTFRGKGISILSASDLCIGASPDNGNHFEHIEGDALTLRQVDWSRIEHNHFEHIQGRGIVLEGAANSVSRNTLHRVEGGGICVSGGYSNEILHNHLLCPADGPCPGILLQNGLSYQVERNTLQGCGMDIRSVNGSPLHGPLQVVSNEVIAAGDASTPCAAIALHSLSHALVMHNVLRDNAHDGVELNHASNVTVLSNKISHNGGTAVRIRGGQYNKISRNKLFANKGYRQGEPSGIVSNRMKTAPVITSVKKSGDRCTVSGNGTLAGDTVELFSGAHGTGTFDGLKQEARQFRCAFTATGSTWSISLPATDTEHFIATATDAQGNTSSFSSPKAVESHTTGFRKKDTWHVPYSDLLFQRTAVHRMGFARDF